MCIKSPTSVQEGGRVGRWVGGGCFNFGRTKFSQRLFFPHMHKNRDPVGSGDR